MDPAGPARAGFRCPPLQGHPDQHRAPRETLTLRLRKLEEAGLVERRQYSQHPPRDEYLLTAARHDIAPVLASLRQWGERHATPLSHLR
ncbi:winged helix-turn-helix transcriptional regulator [Streptomyces sp. NBC_01317]|uniref:winged helix-turn-helix transcriptional regulator n=1 Tax=Streptomyces sp. NBC_01317 TaxID=2903822 RepID=UPI003FA38581